MSHGSSFVPRRFVMALFEGPEQLLAGATKVRKKGYAKLDTHTPYPLHGLEEALGLGRPRIPTIVLCGAITGICVALSMIYYANVHDYPINVANRTLVSLPAWIPITFELAVLLGGTSSFFGVIALMKLPQPYHPVFQWEKFRENSVDGFMLSVELDTSDDADAALAYVGEVGGQHAELITEVER